MGQSVWIGSDLPPVFRNGVEYFVASIDDALFLIPNQCPHRGGPLKFGRLNERAQLVCPMHGNAFCMEALLRHPAVLRLTETPMGADNAP
jgi:nitrite reductase (NADH) small subunit